MKRIIYGLFALSLMLPLSVSAHWHLQNYTRQFRHVQNVPPPAPTPTPTPPPVQTPTPTPTPVPPTASGNTCINYGYGGAGDNHSVDLANLKSHGITCVRLAFNGTNSSATEALAQEAKGQGFYVEIGNDGDPLGGNYAAGVVAEGQWAQQNHIDQMSIGNETAKNTQTQNALAQLSCQVKQVYSGIVSYDTYLDPNGFDDIKAWASNRGCLDKLGLNTYANYQNTYQEAQNLLGAGHWYISEFDLDCDTGVCDNDSTWASGLQNIWTIAQQWNVKTNFFAYRCDGNACPTHWSIEGHPQVQAVLGL